VGNFGNTSGASHDGDDVPSIAEAKRAKIEPTHYTYTERDLILYNLSLGATEKELQWTFESDDQFAVIPTFGVIPQFPASSTISFDFLPDFNPVRLYLSHSSKKQLIFSIRLSCSMANNILLSKHRSRRVGNWSARQGC
jgi:hypothetical protein